MADDLTKPDGFDPQGWTACATTRPPYGVVVQMRWHYLEMLPHEGNAQVDRFEFATGFVEHGQVWEPNGDDTGWTDDVITHWRAVQP